MPPFRGPGLRGFLPGEGELLREPLWKCTFLGCFSLGVGLEFKDLVLGLEKEEDLGDL
jgi:hypothetical protein